jgi:oligoendopeptidase F
VAALARTRADLEPALADLRARLGAATDADFAAFVAREDVKAIAYPLARLRQEASRSMAPELEALAADLGVDGIAAWGRLYDQLSGKLEFVLEVPGRAPERRPVSVVRSLLGDPDPAVRRAGVRGGNRAWEGVGDTVAAALNAIAGTRLTLNRRRGVAHYLEPALFDAAIERETLEVMLAAGSRSPGGPAAFPPAQARALGRERLGFQDSRGALADERRGAARLGRGGGAAPRRLRRLPSPPALRGSGDRAALDRLPAAGRQAPRRVLHQLAAHRRVAHLPDLRRRAG